MSLSFAEYQAKASETAIYPREAAVLYPVLGYAGECGELCEKIHNVLFPNGAPTAWDDTSLFLRQISGSLLEVVKAARLCEALKKMIRDQTVKLPAGLLEDIKQRVQNIPQDSHAGILKEIGDGSCWYAAAIARDLDADLEVIAQGNLDKLAARKAKGTIQGSGDNR